MYLLIIFAPLANVIFLTLFGRVVPSRIIHFSAILSLLISFICCQFMFYEVVILHTTTIVPLASWVQISYLHVVWSLLFDSVSATLVYVVIFISLLVHLYSLDYMSGDPHITRFLSCLSLFTFFMLVMATAGNMLQLFLGWEGVGLASYLLISFWYGRSEASKAAMKAIIVNRIGDFGVYTALLFTVYVFRSLDFGVIFSNCATYANSSLLCFGYEISVLGIIGSCIFLGTVGKSAQIGLHLWLPDAMEGPTPVSALLHAATMVTAGVFILIRFSVLFAQLPHLMLFVGFVGGITSIFAGISACVQYDIKKIIAYSTCSHLGIMLLFCGMSQYDLALFHLFNHAFFKALLFLSAGSVIHALGNEQDIRKMGGLATVLPFTYCMFLIGSLSLIGFPFMSGFYSKDVGWEVLFAKFFVSDIVVSGDVRSWSFFLFILFNCILCLSVVYSFRLIVLAFSGSYNGFKSNLAHLKEPSLFMWLPMLVLAFFSIFVGYFFKDLFIGLGTATWQNVLPMSNITLTAFKELLFAISISNGYQLFLRLFTCLLSLFYLFLLIEYFMSCRGKSLFLWIFDYIELKILPNSYVNFLKYIISFRWFFHFITKNYKLVIKYLSMDHWLYKKLTKIFFYLSYHVSFKSIDRGFLEKFGPFGIVLFLRKLFANVFHFGSTNFYYVITVFLFISLSLLFLFLFGTVEDLFMLLFILLVTLFILGCLK